MTMTFLAAKVFFDFNYFIVIRKFPSILEYIGSANGGGGEGVLKFLNLKYLILRVAMETKTCIVFVYSS